MPRPTTLPEPWRSLADALERQWLSAHPGQKSPGGVTLVAYTLEIDVRTVRRWAERLPAKRRDRDWIFSVFRDAGIEPPK